MKSRPRKLISPKRVEFLLDEPLYNALIRKKGNDITISEYIRRMIEVIVWNNNIEQFEEEDKRVWKTKKEMP